MIGAIHSALSGLTAFSKQIEVTAHNVANISTDGFKKSHVEFVSVETDGVLPVASGTACAKQPFWNNGIMRG